MAKKSDPEYAERMFRLVNEWIRGSETKKSICRRHEIKIHTFNYWLKKFRESQYPETADDFIQINPSSEFIRQTAVRLRFPSGITAEFPAGTAPETIIKILKSV